MKWWLDARPWQVGTPDPQGGWPALTRYLTGSNTEPLKRILSVIDEHGGNAVIIEAGYMGVDYRAEYSAFYSQLFQSVPDSAHRLHFFRFLGPEAVPQSPMEVAARGTYLGYAVLRPLPMGSVARACIAPPPNMRSLIRTSVLDRVHLFDLELTVRGVPFMQQDAQFASCAHAAAWMCHQSGALRGDTYSRPSADFALGVDRLYPAFRKFPTTGLTDAQLSELFNMAGMPAAFYSFEGLGPGVKGHADRLITLFSMLRPYLDSSLPALVAFDDHVVVAVGLGGIDDMEIFYHDDQQGPYLLGSLDRMVSTLSATNQGLSVHVPLPRKAWLPPETAIDLASRRFVRMGKYLQSKGHAGAELSRYWTADGALRVRRQAYMARGIDFKRSLRARGYVGDALSALLMARLPRHVLVVEFLGEPNGESGNLVVGESLCDATYSGADSPIIAWRIGACLVVLPSVSEEKKVHHLRATQIISGIGVSHAAADARGEIR